MGRGLHKRGDARRAAIVAYLARRWQDHEDPPTIAELSAAIGLSTTALMHHVSILRSFGYLHLRSLWLTQHGFQSQEN